MAANGGDAIVTALKNNEDKLCFYCNKKVVASQNCYKDRRLQAFAENEVKPKNDAEYENCEKIILYKRIIQEMEGKYQVMRENNSLLKEKISTLEVKLAEKQDLNENHDNKVHYIQKLPNSDASDHKTQGQNKTNKPHGNRPKKKEEEENKKARTQIREEEEEITKPKSFQRQIVTITNADVASGIQQTLSTLKMNELHALGETTANSDSNNAWRQAKVRRIQVI
ncbi:hypothetical protein JTB14_019725 [Gonioctena quinquepunctata]|nr:hypothetical protein JTB14_019725 [Gonioctena quinquepunctata]